MRRWISTIVLLAIFFSLWKCQVFKEPAAKVMSTTLNTPEIETEPKENYPDADFNLTVKDLDGNLVHMSDYEGKVIFLNFWATWCMPCVAELPSINNLYNQTKDKGIVFLLISNEQLAKVKSYHTKKEYDVPFQVIDDAGKIPSMYYHESIPTTFIINKDGKLVKRSSGAEDWDDEDFIAELEKMF